MDFTWVFYLWRIIFYLDTQKMEWDQDGPDHRYYEPEPSYQNDQCLTELNPSDYQIYYSVFRVSQRSQESEYLAVTTDRERTIKKNCRCFALRVCPVATRGIAGKTS